MMNESILLPRCKMVPYFRFFGFTYYPINNFVFVFGQTADQHLEKLANQFQLKNERHNPEPSAPPLSPPKSSSFNFFSNRKQPSDHRRRPPMPPPSPGRVYRSVAQPPKSNVVQVHLHNQTEYVHTLTHEELDPADFSSGSGSPDESDTVINRRLNGTKFRFRRSK